MPFVGRISFSERNRLTSLAASLPSDIAQTIKDCPRRISPAVNIFSLSLKDEYNPDLENEDYLIEDVLQRAFIEEHLEYQVPRLEFDAQGILTSKKGAINVEKYKAMFSKMRKKRKRKQARKLNKAKK